MMNCPKCGGDTKVYETRKYNDPEGEFDYIQRRRKCVECGEPFIGIEVTLDTWLWNRNEEIND